MSAADASTGRRRPGLRWRHGAIALAMVLVPMLGIGTWMEIVRVQGRARFDAVTAAIHQCGHPATVADFLALVPPVDAAHQEQWLRWQQRFRDGPMPDVPALEGRELSTWLVGQRSQPPAALVHALAAAAPRISEARALLRQGALTLGVLGWAAADIAAGPGRTAARMTSHCEDLLVYRSLAQWLRQDALLSNAPEDDLADLERLTTALSRPGCLIDAMVAVAIARMRDQCHVELAYAGRLPRDREERWCREPARALTWVADGFRWDRLYGLVGTDESLRQTVVGYLIHKDAWTSYGRALHDWVDGVDEAARLADVEDQIETRMRQPAPDHGPIAGLDSLLSGNSYQGFLIACPTMALTAAAQQRASHIAVRVLEHVRQGAPLPQTAAALLALCGDPGLLAHGTNTLGLIYQRLGPDRFRLAIDAAAPVPDFGDPAHSLVTEARAMDAAVALRTSVDCPLLLGSAIEMQLPESLRHQRGTPAAIQQGAQDARGTPRP